MQYGSWCRIEFVLVASTVASLNMPSLGHTCSLPSKYQILCNYLNPQLKLKLYPQSITRFKMATMLDFRKPYCWPMYTDFPSLYQILWTNFDRRPKYGPKTEFKMAAAAIVNWFSMAILTHCLLSTIDLNQRAKFCGSISVDDWIIITCCVLMLQWCRVTVGTTERQRQLTLTCRLWRVMKRQMDVTVHTTSPQVCTVSLSVPVGLTMSSSYSSLSLTIKCPLPLMTRCL